MGLQGPQGVQMSTRLGRWGWLVLWAQNGSKDVGFSTSIFTFLDLPSTWGSRGGRGDDAGGPPVSGG